MKKVYYIAEKTTKAKCGEIILPLIKTLVLKDEKLESKLKNADSLIFTSKRAITFLEKTNKKWHHLPCYVLGKGTQKALDSLCLKPFFIGSTHYGDSFANELKTTLKHKKPLFIHGEKCASHLFCILKDYGIDLEESILYKSEIIELKSKEALNKNSIIFFSAPSRIDAFLQNFTWDESFIALCIGATTAGYCKEKLPQAKVKIAKNTDILECLKEAKMLLKDDND